MGGGKPPTSLITGHLNLPKKTNQPTDLVAGPAARVPCSFLAAAVVENQLLWV